MRIIGIDPGLATTGYGILQSDGQKSIMLAFGCVTTVSGLATPERLELIYEGLRKIVEEYRPDVMTVEKLFFTSNCKSVMQVGEARGVALLVGQLAKLPIYEYTPLQVKQSVVGYGRAEKQQVQQMVKLLLGLPKIPKPDDAADALAIALCHAHAGSTVAAIARRGNYV